MKCFWFFHKWSLWGTAINMGHIWKTEGRVCEKCGKFQERWPFEAEEVKP